MDSLTQITLGAAVGEVVLGKKVGNRAMVWGAIAGTMPDLDVLANFAGDELSSLAFHRAITHSISFAVLAPIAMGWIVHRLYNKGHSPSQFGLDLAKVFAGFVLLTGLGTAFMPIPIGQLLQIALLVSLGMIFFPLIVWLRQRLRRGPTKKQNASVKEWSWLFFWAIFTHPLLDSCTTYGTQLFQPFSDYRVGLNNISVADPIYTVPFLICLIAAAVISRHKPVRRTINYLGIGLSSAYLLFTFYNKHRVNQVFEESFQEQGIDYNRFMTSPTIFNNALWNGVAEGDTAFYQGLYSIFDQEPKVTHFITIPKKYELVEEYQEERFMKVFPWFSNGYYSVLRRKDGRLQINDLRFGSMSTSSSNESDFVFKWIIEEQNGKPVVVPSGPPSGSEDAFKDLWERIKGI